MRARRNEMDVSVYGKTSRGKNAFAADGMDACQAGCFDKFEPFFNAAGSAAVAIMIHQTFAPGDAKALIVRASKECGVLSWNMALVVVAIERPSLHLAAAQRSFVHEFVKRVLMVIALFADRVKSGDEVGFGEQMPFRSHRVSSIPS